MTMQRNSSGSVELRDLTAARDLAHLRILHVASPTSPVRDLALITDIEEITSVGPDTIVILTQGVARGGWMISAALRYAWERRACALIVPEQSYTETVIELARRLGVSLLTTERGMTRLALDVAIQIGVARAGSLARVQSFTERVSQAADLAQALDLISSELGGAPVALETSGAIAVSVPGDESAADAEADRSTVRRPVSLTQDGRQSDALSTEVPSPARTFAEQIFSAAIPSIRALLTSSRLQATRESLPAISITALTGTARLRGLRPPSPEFLDDVFRWPVNGDYIAVCVITDDRERVGTAVHQIWNAGFPDVPLARFSDGWVGFVPVADADRRAELVERMRQQLAGVPALGLAVGVSGIRRTSEQAVDGVHEAWLAASVADPRRPGTGSLVGFEDASSRLLDRFLPDDLALQLASAMLPELVADPAAEQLIAAVVAYLSNQGSITAAAAHLGVHRNTLQARIRRAEQLGVRLSPPEEVLPTHMLLAALVRAGSEGGER